MRIAHVPRLVAVAVAVLPLLALATVARADDACRADRDKLCPGVQKGGGRLEACMNEHAAELSEACQQQRGAVAAAKGQISAACSDDARRLCAGVQKGAGRIFKCLRDHEADLGPACKEAIAEGQAVHEAIHPGCRADADRLCAGVEPGKGRLRGCLMSHAAELSPGCREKLAEKQAK